MFGPDGSSRPLTPRRASLCNEVERAPDLRPSRCEELPICFPRGPAVVALRSQNDAAPPQGPTQT